MQSSDAREFEIAGIVRGHHLGLGRYLRRLGCPRDRVDDILHDTFLAVLLRRPEDRGEIAMRRYLKTAARNAYVDHLRRGKKAAEIAAVVQLRESLRDDARDDEEIAALRVCLEELAPRSREAIRMHYGTDGDRSTVGEALGISVEGVKTLLRRAREVLRGCIEKRMGR